MDTERKIRYRQKLNFIIEKVHDLNQSADGDIKKDELLYRIQTSIESAMDIIAMLVKDCGRDVSDDYGNIHVLEKERVLNAAQAKKMAQLNGLRNAIVHKYNSFEEKTVIKERSIIKKLLEGFVERVEETINKNK